jgi:hypothetical protein
MRKVYLNVMFQVIVLAEEGVDISEVMNELDYNFSSNTANSDIYDSAMIDFEVTDSK